MIKPKLNKKGIIPLALWLNKLQKNFYSRNLVNLNRLPYLLKNLD